MYSAHNTSIVNGLTPRELTKKLIEIWCRRSGRNPNRVKLLKKRVIAVQARINEGYTPDDLCMAIAGVCYSPFHRDNGYNTFDVAIRNGVQVEKGIALWLRYAPINYILDYVRRTGETVPEREEELRVYRKKRTQHLDLQSKLDRVKEAHRAEEETRSVQSSLDAEFTKECGG